MNRELLFILEPDTARITVEVSHTSKQTVDAVTKDLGTRINLNCAKPADQQGHLPVLQMESKELKSREADAFSLWVYRLYHNSVVDGPGRRSVVQVSGCSIQCEGCFVRQTWDIQSGRRVSVSSIVHEVLAHKDAHDGVTVLGGEPFDQPESIAELVSRLKHRGLHITVYSGYTREQLIEQKKPAIDYIMTHIDLLIDGPFVSSMREGSGEYRGSRNQRLLCTNVFIYNLPESLVTTNWNILKPGSDSKADVPGFYSAFDGLVKL